MKKNRLFLAGQLPLVCGFLLNLLINALLNAPMGFLLPATSVILTYLWGYAAFRLYDKGENLILSVCKLNAFGALMLALVLFQELVLGYYRPNLVGGLSQFYFLPCLSASILVTNPIIGLFTQVRRFCIYYTLEYIIMILVSLLGCMKKRKIG